MHRTVGLAIAIAFATAGIGCDTVTTACDRSSDGNPALPYTQGTVQNGVYESSPVDGEWLYFPGGMRYAIEHKLTDCRLSHCVGIVPRDIQLYLSFERYGTRNGEGTEAIGAGDPAQIQGIDTKTITVINGTCSEYYLRVVASE